MTHVLIAASLRQADLTATIDWGWAPRVDRTSWQMPDGTVVEYAGSGEKLRGRTDLVIHFGYGAFLSPAREVAEQRIATGHARKGCL